MTSALTLLQLRPDLLQLRRWLVGSRQSALLDDLGYAAHACAKAALGELAPKPFALQQSGADCLLLGYVQATPDAIDRAVSQSLADPLAASALGLGELKHRALPTDWRSGERLRFKLRAVPMVRSRSQPDGGVHEVDAARHPKFATQDTPRESAYEAWLGQELARDGAAELLACELRGFEMHHGVRRQSRSTSAPRTSRATRGAWLPDAQFSGVLRIASADAFCALLARGVGRHRAFGFGCLLLAPV
jgi:CRISPR system Cascade subunit CasE